MTSLEKQLKQLSTPAAAQLTAERRFSSFLFDRKQVASFDRETLFKIGQQGLDELIELDQSFAPFKSTLFSQSSQYLQRSVMTAQENSQLDSLLEKFLFHLCPYFLLSPAHKALEWLIQRYQLNQFNAESMLMLGLPYHETNTFLRLLQVVDFSVLLSSNNKNNAWKWLVDFGKNGQIVSRRAVINQCLASGHFLVGFLCDKLMEMIEVLKEEKASKCQIVFSFVAAILTETVTDGTLITDKLMSKIIPFLATGLKSSVKPFRLCCMVITCQLATIVTLNDNVVHSLLKLLLLKSKSSTIKQSLTCVIVLCQRQNVSALPSKPLIKLATRAQDLAVCEHLTQLTGDKVAVTKFLPIFWRGLLTEIIIGVPKMDGNSGRDACLALLLQTLDESKITFSYNNAALFLRTILTFLETTKELPAQLQPVVRRLCLQHSTDFDQIREEWTVRDSATLQFLIDQCEIPPYELGEIEAICSTKERKRRRRRTSSKQSIEGSEILEFSDSNKAKEMVEREEQSELAEVTPFEAVKAKKPRLFDGDPFDVFEEAIKSGDLERAVTALANIDENYWLLNKSAKKKDNFMELALKSVSEKALSHHIRSTFSRIPISTDLACDLLKRYYEIMSKFTKCSPQDGVNSDIVTTDENPDEEKGQKLTFLLEVFHANTALKTSVRLTQILFEIVEKCLELSDKTSDFGGVNFDYLTQLAISLLAKLVSESAEAELRHSKISLNIDLIVRVIRTSKNRHTLREALRLLTVVTKVSQEDVLSRVMSVFTFMGAGLFRKDDQYTLSIVQQTIDALFAALTSQNSTINVSVLDGKLVEIYRVFASSLRHIPSHRRLAIFTRIVEKSQFFDSEKEENRAAENCNNNNNNNNQEEKLWLLVGVIFEDFCVRWHQKMDEKGLAEFLLTVCNHFSPIDQLSCAANLLGCILRLGSDDQNSKDESNDNIRPEPFDARAHSTKKLRHFRFIIFGWLAQLLSDSNLINMLAQLNAAELSEQLGSVGQKLFANAMEAEDFVSRQLAAQSERGDVQYWKALAARSDLVLKRLRALLPVSTSLILIENLLKRDNTKLKQRALDLLNTKLLQQPTPFTRNHVPSLAKFVAVLSEWLQIKSQDDESGDKIDVDQLTLLQTAAFSIKLFARVIGTYDRDCFNLPLERCVAMIQKRKSLNELLLSNLLLCVSEMVACLKTASLGSIPKLMPHLLKILAKSDKNSNNNNNKKSGNTLLTVSATICLQRVVCHLGPFLSPYLTPVLLVVCRLEGNLNSNSAIFAPAKENDSTEDIFTTLTSSKEPKSRKYHHQKITEISDNIGQQICQRLADIRKQLAISVENRVLLEPLKIAYETLLREKSTDHLRVYFDWLGLHFEQISQQEIDSRLDTILEFLFSTLSLRSDFEIEVNNEIPESLNQDNSDLESHLLNSIVKLTLRLSENTFRPVVFRLAEWTEKSLDEEADFVLKNRALTGFALCNKIADSLGVLFTLFAAQFFAMIPRVLERCNAHKTRKKQRIYKNDGEKHEQLIVSALNLARKCCWSQFITGERFDSLVGPIADELANTKTGTYLKRIQLTLAPCTGQLITTLSNNDPSLGGSGGDLRSRALNTAILMQTRSPNPLVRHGALLVLKAIYTAMGEAVAVLMPDTVPFLAELLEDENEDVETECQKVIGLLETVVADGVQQYF